MLILEQNDSDTAIRDTKAYRVLLVSGNELITFSLENFFADSNVSITLAPEQKKCIESLKQDAFDAVIADLSQDMEASIRLRQEVRKLDAKIPILFMTPMLCWSDVRLLDQIVEDPYSYYVPENADRKFMLAKLEQVIHVFHAGNELTQLQNKIARNLFLASALQQAMLPPWVYFSKNYEFSCLYRPFSEVSGDLYEWLPLDEDRALFIFGDVSGHGTHSALAISAIQSFLKQLILVDRERAAQPCLIASEINRFFCRHLHNLVHMSTLVAYIDFRNNVIRCQNSGYMDILCVNADTGEIEDINPQKKGCIPLGMVKDFIYTDKDTVEYHFSDSSVFLFSSDGLMSLSKDEKGEERMDMEKGRRLISMLVKEIQKEDKSIVLPFRFLHSLEQFGYPFPQDDLTLVLVRKPKLNEHEYVFSCRAPANKKAVDEICEKASAFVTGYYKDDLLSVQTELLLEEYLMNVIMYGLNEDEMLNDYIAVKLCAFEKELKLIVWDHGKEWDGFYLQPENAEESLDQLNDSMATSGRGIPIITKIASQISRQRFCGLNETTFIIPQRVWD